MKPQNQTESVSVSAQSTCALEVYKRSSKSPTNSMNAVSLHLFISCYCTVTFMFKYYDRPEVTVHSAVVTFSLRILFSHRGHIRTKHEDAKSVSQRFTAGGADRRCEKLPHAASSNPELHV